MKTDWIRNRLRELRTPEFGRYLITGLSTVTVDFAVFTALHKAAGLSATVSNVCSLTVSLCWSYLANRIFVFRTRSRGRELRAEIAKYFSARITTVLLELALVALLSDGIGMDGVVSKILTQAVIFACNWIASKYWAFRKKT